MGCQTFLPCKSQEMLKGKFLINNYMKDFEYYGLFLTEESKAELKTWLINSNYQLEILNSVGTLPMDLQKFIADQQQKIVVALTAKNLAGEGPEAMLGMLLMRAMLGNKDSDE
jgi:hypothetical protein